MSKRKTDAEYRIQLKEAHPDIEAITFYVNNKIKIKFKHLICGTEWWALPMDVIKSKIGCPVCSEEYRHKAKTFPLQIIIEQVFIMSEGTIEYVSGYINTIIKCKWRCVLCGKEWEATPHEILRRVRHGCSKCAHKHAGKKKITPLEIVIEQIKIITNDTIEYLDDYIDKHHKCKWKCKVCGNIWETKPDTILNGSGCPICVKHSLEKPVMQALKEKNITPLYNTALKGSNYNGSTQPLKVDFIIETSKGKLAIETDGKQHFVSVYGEEALKLQQARDRHKDKILKERGFILIRVTSSPTKKWGFKNHITLKELLKLIETGIDSKTGEIDFELFKKYDFNRE